MDEEWNINELAHEIAARLTLLPPPTNGQVRAVPDERTIRYYVTLGLLDRPVVRGRTAFYGPRQLAQVIAIKRLQAVGHPLAEIQEMWGRVDDRALVQMSGVSLETPGRMIPTARPRGLAGSSAEPSGQGGDQRSGEVGARPGAVRGDGAARTARGEVAGGEPRWRTGGTRARGEFWKRGAAGKAGTAGATAEETGARPVGGELRIGLGAGVELVIAAAESVALGAAEVRAVRAAAAELLNELARRRLTTNDGGTR